MATCAVIGLGQLGVAVATELSEKGADVIAIDSDEARVDAIKDKVATALCLDATDEKALRAAGVADCGTVVLALGEGALEQAVLTTMLLREIGVGRIIARAGSDVQGKVLERLGVSRVVMPERQIGVQVARQILSPAVQELVPISEEASLAEVAVTAAMDGKSLAELQLRRAYGINAVALRHARQVVRDDGTVTSREEVSNVLGPETVLTAGDTLVVVGPDAGIRELVARS